MRTRRRATIEDLRLTVQCLPRHTRVAMLEGLRTNEIIVGAYSKDGGICPMLAAHRAGGRTNMISFAKAWDRFALGGARVTRPRRATARELNVLVAHLEASLLDEEAPQTELASAIESHRRLVTQRCDQESRIAPPNPRPASTEETRASEPDKPRPGDPNRAPELRGRRGWAWTRLVRTYNEYERALDWIEREQAALDDAAQRRERGRREQQPA
jgi:hypothetical protein